ncbi:MAG: hypothetical protein J5822_00535 [Eubacteriaceae bacterium]|nr:hypothetical protein [Eubacteriaceae bacterium]
MESEKTLKEYIYPLKGTRIAALVCVVLSLILGFLAMIPSRPAESSAVPFDPKLSANREWCYVDVAAVSPPAFTYNKRIYFVLMGADGTLYPARLTTPQYYTLYGQAQYWSDPTSDVPALKRFYGMARKINNVMQRAAGGVTGADERMTAPFFSETMFFDATAIPGANRDSAFLSFSIVFMLIASVLYLMNAAVRARARRSLKRLRDTGYIEEAAGELYNALMNNPEDVNWLLTPNYVFLRGEGTALRLTDIYWIFTRHYYKRGRYIAAKTVDKREMLLIPAYGDMTDEGIQRVYEHVKKVNPEVITGANQQDPQ